MNEYLIIGKLIGAHGVRGEVKVFPITDDVRRFRSLKKCYLMDEKEKMIREMEISSSRIINDRVLLTFSSIIDRDEAAKLNGLFIAVNRLDARKLEPGRYFISDMIGCRIIDDSETEIGVIFDVVQTGANDVIAVKRSGKPDLYIPYLNNVVTDVDVFSKIVKVRLPDGLLEVYES
jgi:16S rRNA processing protein RimM